VTHQLAFFHSFDTKNQIIYLVLQGWCGKNQSGKYRWFLLVFTTRLEIFTAVVAEKARGGNFLHFLRHGGNKFYFPPPQRK
jgi:hypothetical protein